MKNRIICFFTKHQYALKYRDGKAYLACNRCPAERDLHVSERQMRKVLRGLTDMGKAASKSGGLFPIDVSYHGQPTPEPVMTTNEQRAEEHGHV